MPTLITISGLDGSGKSTQIEMLKNYLKSHGKSFYYFHAVSFSIANKFEVSPRVARGETSNGARSVTKANWIEIQLRKIALLVDIFRFNRLAKKLKVDYIISDRYFYDSVVNINYLSLKFGNPISKLFAEKFIPKPDFAFFVKISPEAIMQRERKPDQGMGYLVEKEKLFEQKIKDWRMIVVDGEKDKIDIRNDIANKIQNNGEKGKI